MNGLLLDTNVVSEMTKSPADPRVVAFLQVQRHLWLSAIVIHELEFGIQILPQGRRRNLLRDANQRLVANFNGRILPLGRLEAEQAAAPRVRAQSCGHMLKLADALVAGTALANRLSVATRNVKHFVGLGVAIVNPWETP